jgi:hypothetical protein
LKLYPDFSIFSRIFMKNSMLAIFNCWEFTQQNALQ